MVDNKKEFEKLQKVAEEKAKELQSVKVKRINIMSEGNNGENCFYKEINECRKRSPFVAVEGNCICGDYQAIINIGK